jgi:uncharacterized membrane protein YkoI
VALVHFTCTQNNTQNNKTKQNTQNGTYITIRIPKVYVYKIIPQSYTQEYKKEPKKYEKYDKRSSQISSKL